MYRIILQKGGIACLFEVAGIALAILYFLRPTKHPSKKSGDAVVVAAHRADISCPFGNVRSAIIDSCVYGIISIYH